MSSNRSGLLVTGGAGYIGSHAVLALLAAGHRVVVLDNLVYGHRQVVPPEATFVEGDIADRALVDRVLSDHAIDAVMHFSAYAYVGESVTDPRKYYHNNVLATMTLLDAMLAAGIHQFVFSSTCATYGVPESVPIREDAPQRPINPYGWTKLMVERILADYDRAYGLRSVVFRYFNAAGADPEGRTGEDHDPETHLIPLVLDAAAGRREAITVFGTDYDTPDGTCVRDYIHVADLAEAHVRGMEHLRGGGVSEAFNLGNGAGYSVREVIDTAQRVTGREIPVVEGPRRAGDPPRLVGSAEKARRTLGWQPRYADLETIVRHAWAWHENRTAAHGNT